MSQNEKIFVESQLPKGWRWLKLKDVIREFVNGGTPNTNIPQFWIGGIPWITSADIKSLYVSKGRKYISQEGLDNSSTHLVKKDTVLIATRTGVGKVAIAENDLCFSQDITGAICSDKVLPEFLARFLLSQGDNLVGIQRGATIKGLTRGDIESIYIPLPPLSEQSRIAAKIRELLQEVDRARAGCEKQLKELEVLPRAILMKAFKGNL
jgi:restriction endonuclease S subunit